MSDTTSDTDTASLTDPVVARAHRRWLRCHQWESIARKRWTMDLKFAHGDSYNNYQWPSTGAGSPASRGDRPSLTVNETQQHNLHIKNEAKQNKASVKYRPTGAGASPEAATDLEGIYRHIANISNAQMAQGTAIDFQVDAGLGFTLIESAYVDENSFDQEIYIRTVENPMSVYLDPDSRELDGSDARFGFVFADKPRDEMEAKYQELKGRMSPTNAIDGEDGGWMRPDHIREARYYEVVEKHDELLGAPDGTTILKSLTTPDLVERWEEQAKAAGGRLRRRPVVRKEAHCHHIIGDMTVDTEETRIPGKSVPIIPWCGAVTVIDGELDRKGHTRTMISAQQMENYNWSASVEFGALQGKTPYVGPMKAFEGFETYWETANTANHAFIPYNHVDDDGQPIPPPTRQQPPSSAPVYMEGVQLARQFMLSASGQYEAEMGAPGNERSGRAINERQRQGDRATYHFIDNQALAIRRQGQIVLEWVPEIYDTPRVLRILGEDGTESHVQIDPQAQDAHQAAEADGIASILNPSVGRYEVVSDVGPDYATQRQEAFNAIVQILTQAPQLIDRIGDLLFKVADFPLADQIAERLQPGLPPAAQQQIAALQEQLQKAEAAGANTRKLLEQAMQALTEERLKVKAKDAEGSTDAFKADTDRVKMLLDAATKADPGWASEMIRRMSPEAVMQAMQDNLGPVRTASEATLDREAQGQDLPGATGALPIRTPDVGDQVATPGGM